MIHELVECDTPDETDAIHEADEGHLQAWHELLLSATPEEQRCLRRMERQAIELRWLR